MALNFDGFHRIVDRQFKQCYDVLFAKTGKYAADGDPLHNFNVASGLLGNLPREALAGMMSKHVVRLFDMIRDPSEIPMEQWDETITDTMNYLVLLKVMMAESIMDEVQGSIPQTTMLPTTPKTSMFPIINQPNSQSIFIPDPTTAGNATQNEGQHTNA